MKRTHATGWTLLTTMMLAALLGLVGCSDDPVTPHEDTELTPDDVAHQTGFIIYSMVELLPTMSTKAFPSEQTLAGFAGSYWQDSDPDDHVWTDADHLLSWTPEGFEIAIDVAFDLFEVGGLASGTGRLTANALDASFTLTDVDVPSAGNYPDSGTVLVSSGGIAAMVTFLGGPTAQVQIATQTWTVDLTDGTIIS